MCVWCGMVKRPKLFLLRVPSRLPLLFTPIFLYKTVPTSYFFFLIPSFKFFFFFFTPLRVIYLPANALFNVVDHSRQSLHSFDMFWKITAQK